MQTLHLVHNLTRLFGSGKHAARFDQEGASRRCQIDMSCRPDKQRRTEFVLQRPDRCGQTGLDNRQPERCPGEFCLDATAKVFELSQIHGVVQFSRICA